MGFWSSFASSAGSTLGNNIMGGNKSKVVIENREVPAKTSNNDVVSGNNTTGSGNTTVVQKDSFWSVLKNSEAEDEVYRTRKMAELNHEQEMENMVMTGNAEELCDKIQKLITYVHTFSEYEMKNGEADGIVDKIEFGIIKLNGLGNTAESAFFEKKLIEVKEKIAKKKAGTFGVVKDGLTAGITGIKGLIKKNKKENSTEE